MGKYQLRFVVSIFCIILQCNLNQATPPSDKPTNGGCNVYQFRIPISSISNNGNNSPQCPQCNSNYPYPYYSQLAQYYSNICNSCQGSLCRSKCNNNNQLTFSNPSNSLTVSLPTNTPGGRTTLILDTRTKPVGTEAAPDTADQPAPDNNGENNMDVIVKIVPIDTDNANATALTSAQSKAVHNEDGNRITALTTAQEVVPSSAQNFQVSVFVNDVNTGSLPAKTSLRSQILSENTNGDVLASKTNSVIEKKSKIVSTDGGDSNVTGKSPPAKPDDKPAEDSPPPAKPDADKPPPAKPDDDKPPPAKPDADKPPADSPKPDTPPADKPADSADAVALADDDGAAAAAKADSG